MRRPLCPFLTVAALLAIGGFAAAGSGCASKPPQPEPAASAAPSQNPPSKPAGAGTSAGAEGSSAGTDASAVPSASAAPGTPAGAALAPAGTGAPGDAIGSAGGSASSGAASAGSGADGGASPDSPGGSALPRNRAQTSDERRAALDKRLDDSLGSFDAQLRKEQQKIALERDSRQATVTTVAPDGSTTVSSDENVGAGDERTTDRPHEPVGSHRGATDSRSPRSGDLKSDRTAGGPVSSSGNGAVASEIPDGNDDDVIARRLRKAAEQETDPELRDKLWKEYVEYKRNAQGQ